MENERNKMENERKFWKKRHLNSGRLIIKRTKWVVHERIKKRNIPYSTLAPAHNTYTGCPISN